MGISEDPVDQQKAFRESLKLPFPLLSDADGKAASAYGVLDGSYANRVTFVIDPKGTVTHVERDKLTADSAADACPLPKKKQKEKPK